MNYDAYKKNNNPEKGGQLGVYKHPMRGDEELHATSFPIADAMLRQGWYWAGELPKSEQPSTVNNVQPNAFAEIQDLEARLADAKSRAGVSVAQSKENAKTESDENKRAAEETLERENARQAQEEQRNKSQEKVEQANKQLSGKENK
jgi:hypothetical protein